MQTKLCGYPIHVLNGETEAPNAEFYYVVASNGIFCRKNDGIFISDTKLDTIEDLDDYQPLKDFQYNLAKIPGNLINEIKLFFKLVVQKFKSESCIILHYNKHTKEYIFSVPTQVVSHGSVHYDRLGVSDQLPLGYLTVGTIHSHCDFQAFHSGTDVGDEAEWDGIHITFGHNDQDNFTISSTVVKDGVRKEIDPMEICDGIKLEEGDRYSLISSNEEEIKLKVSEWLENVHHHNFNAPNILKQFINQFRSVGGKDSDGNEEN